MSHIIVSHLRSQLISPFAGVSFCKETEKYINIEKLNFTKNLTKKHLK